MENNYGGNVMEQFYERLTILWLIFMTAVAVCYVKANGGVRNTLEHLIQIILIEPEKDEG